MSAVNVEKTAAGYAVHREFRSLPAAMRAVDALLAVNEAAYGAEPPVTFCVGSAHGGNTVANPVSQETGD